MWSFLGHTFCWFLGLMMAIGTMHIIDKTCHFKCPARQVDALKHHFKPCKCGHECCPADACNCKEGCCAAGCCEKKK